MFAARLAFVVVFEVTIDFHSTIDEKDYIHNWIFSLSLSSSLSLSVLYQQHIVFIITGLMQFVIPDIPVEMKLQMSREALLEKESKYQSGLKKSEELDYNNVLQSMQNHQTTTRPGLLRGSWARRLSRVTDGLDAHVEIASKPKRKLSTVLWEVT